ncbi:putative endonuclease 4 [Labeo rohita]|uniref:Endonuclease 4 n=1 Tax=Labeo rohita TaxID=84645 RepID=A0ABQ8M1J8_LABRO|nr:putative endonuclease 4 [Labeo rohita]
MEAFNNLSFSALSDSVKNALKQLWVCVCVFLPADRSFALSLSLCVCVCICYLPVHPGLRLNTDCEIDREKSHQKWGPPFCITNVSCSGFFHLTHIWPLLLLPSFWICAVTFKTHYYL